MARKNLLGNRDVYNRYYGDFRGVDFSSDHTQVHEQRLSYLVNMYRDYRSGQGKALETIAGFRRRVQVPGGVPVYGIHPFEADGVPHILIHAGTQLYSWHNYPLSIGVELQKTLSVPADFTEDSGVRTYSIRVGDHVSRVLTLTTPEGEDITANVIAFDREAQTITVAYSDLQPGDAPVLTYYEGELHEEDALFSSMGERRSVSFVFNNRLYLIDGKNYLVYDGESVRHVTETAYVPTTYINIIPSGENADIGTEYEQRNMLSPLFRHTFIADGETKKFTLNERDLDAIEQIKVYGKVLTEGYTVDVTEGSVTFDSAPQRPEDAEGSFPEFYAGVEITARKTLTSVSGVTEARESIHELITECTIATVFDNRVFFSGNPSYPNHIFFCGRNLTGYVDPTYFGVLNYMQDGVGNAPITGMIPVADTLMVLKSDAKQDGSVYFHSPTQTGIDLQPKIYPATQGLSGIGCLGACINFLDDPVFVSRLGVEAVGQLSVRYERAVEHRSSLIDTKLVNTNLSDATLEEWDGYLCVLVDGNVYLADSRQKYMHDIGVAQYEWYYLEGIGLYDGQYRAYRYSSQLWSELEGRTVSWCPVCGKSGARCECGGDDVIQIPLTLASAVYDADLGEYNDLIGQTVNVPDEDGMERVKVFHEVIEVRDENTVYHVPVYYTVHEVTDVNGAFLRWEAHLCEDTGAYIGGAFRRALVLRNMRDNLFFGTENGVVCSFNFDMRNDTGEIPTRYYSFDNRAIFCGCATRMDNCGIPHLTKSTVKKSTVIKTRSSSSSTVKIKVRTNRKPYTQIARINSTRFSFDSLDFSDFTFITTEQSLFAIKEKEKKWVEKQYFLFSDEFMKPFSLYYISYRYQIAGRYKE